MANQSWEKRIPFDARVALRSQDLLDLLAQLRRTDLAKIQLSFLLQEGETRRFDYPDDLIEIPTDTFKAAIQISIQGETDDTFMMILFSRRAYLSSSLSLEGSNRTIFYLVKGIVDDFTEKHSTFELTIEDGFVAFSADDVLRGLPYGLSLVSDTTPLVSTTQEQAGVASPKGLDIVPLGKKLRRVPTELPNAKIYLDDIDEISRILLDACKEEKVRTGPDPQLIFETGSEEFYALSELEDRGGSSTTFSIRVKGSSIDVSFRGILRPDVNLIGIRDSVRWTTYGKIKSVFESRGYPVKNALSSLPAWLKVTLYLGWILVVNVLPRSTRKVYFLSLAIYLLMTALIGMEVIRRSTVVFRQSHKVTGILTERRRGYLQNLGFTVLGALLSPLVQALWDYWRKK